MNGPPLLSCIMPTANRRQYVPAAIARFLGQDHSAKELVVLDNGSESVADLVPAHPSIRYVRETSLRTLGALRNRACELASGDIIAHWDDDDWYPHDRLSRQVQAMLSANADVSGSSRLYFRDADRRLAWEYAFSPSGRRWVAGATLVYRKAFWERNRFREVQIGEDCHFVWGHAARHIADLADPGLCVASIHAGNTSPKRPAGTYWKVVDPKLVDRVIEEAERKEGSARAAAGTVGRAQICADCDRYLSEDKRQHAEGGRVVKLNLGCCDAPVPGFVNVDIVAGPGVDTVADLREPWPWLDDSADHIRACDVIEHLPDKIMTMNQIWRVLKPGATVEIAVPTTDGSGAFQDPTHVSFWNRRSFLYYEAGNPYRERFAGHYGILAKFRTVSERTERTLDGPRLTIVLAAVKP